MLVYLVVNSQRYHRYGGYRPVWYYPNRYGGYRYGGYYRGRRDVGSSNSTARPLSTMTIIGHPEDLRKIHQLIRLGVPGQPGVYRPIVLPGLIHALQQSQEPEVSHHHPIPRPFEGYDFYDMALYGGDFYHLGLTEPYYTRILAPAADRK